MSKFEPETQKPAENSADLRSLVLTNISVEVSSEHVKARVHDLAVQLRERSDIQGIIAILQGGATPADLLAAELGISSEKKASVVISRYSTDGSAGPPRIHTAAEIPDGGRGWLIVDEIAGKGDTLLSALALYPQAEIAVLHSYPEALEKRRVDGTPLIDYYSQEVGSHIWIVYPWERAEVDG